MNWVYSSYVRVFPVMYKVYSSYITGYIQVMYRIYSNYVQGLFQLYYRVYSNYEQGLFKLCTVQDMIKLLKILPLFMTLKIKIIIYCSVTHNY